MKLMEIFEQRVAKLAEQDEAMPIEPVQMAEPEDMPAEPMMAEPHEPEMLAGANSLRDQLTMLAAEGELGDMCDMLCLCFEVMTDEQIEEIARHLGLCEDVGPNTVDAVAQMPDGEKIYIIGRNPANTNSFYCCDNLETVRRSKEKLKDFLLKIKKRALDISQIDQFKKSYGIVTKDADELKGAKKVPNAI